MPCRRPTPRTPLGARQTASENVAAHTGVTGRLNEILSGDTARERATYVLESDEARVNGGVERCRMHLPLSAGLANTFHELLLPLTPRLFTTRLIRSEFYRPSRGSSACRVHLPQPSGLCDSQTSGPYHATVRQDAV